MIARRQVPRTELRVSTVCLGTMMFGKPVEEPHAIRLTHWALEHGVNFIDTANIYEGYARTPGSSGGVAEEILGKSLRGRREEVILATKVGMKVGPEAEDEFTSPTAISKQLDLSLARLATDYIDIYYLHKPDPNTPLLDILSALTKAITNGKIRHYGVSNFSADQIAKLLKTADQNSLPRPVLIQPSYSLLNRDIERDLLPLCERENIAVTPYGVLQAGLLTGKYQRGQAPPPGSRKAEADDWVRELTDDLFDQLDLIRAEAEQHRRTLLAHAILSVLEQPAVVSVLLGAKRVEQLTSLIDIVRDV